METAMQHNSFRGELMAARQGCGGETCTTSPTMLLNPSVQRDADPFCLMCCVGIAAPPPPSNTHLVRLHGMPPPAAYAGKCQQSQKPPYTQIKGPPVPQMLEHRMDHQKKMTRS